MTLSEISLSLSLSLSKDKAEVLASRLKEKNLLKQDVRITHFRQRNTVFQKCFSVDGPLCFCSDIDVLFKCLSLNHDPAEWRLFIDSSKRSLKAVLLHNGNLKPSIPIAHSVHLHESYEHGRILTQGYACAVTSFLSAARIHLDTISLIQ